MNRIYQNTTYAQLFFQAVARSRQELLAPVNSPEFRDLLDPIYDMCMVTEFSGKDILYDFDIMIANAQALWNVLNGSNTLEQSEYRFYGVYEVDAQSYDTTIPVFLDSTSGDDDKAVAAHAAALFDLVFAIDNDEYIADSFKLEHLAPETVLFVGSGRFEGWDDDEIKIIEARSLNDARKTFVHFLKELELVENAGAEIDDQQIMVTSITPLNQMTAERLVAAI